MASAPVAAPEKDDMVSRFKEMALDFKGKTDDVIQQINGAFNTNVSGAVKNYQELMKNYLDGYTGLTSGAQKANADLLASMDKNYAEFKKQVEAMFSDTVSKTDGSITTGTTDFKTQCEDIVKKFPQIPESTYKDVLKAIADNKTKLNGQLEKQYKDIMQKIDKNYEAVKKQLTLPNIKIGDLPKLDLSPGILDAMKGAVSTVVAHVQPVVVNVQQKMTAKDNKPPFK